MISIVDFEPHHRVYFEQMNRCWIEQYFVMESIDEYVLTRPEEAIIKPGGAILMALDEGLPAGTVALRKVDDVTYEFTKMAVDEAHQRKGIAEALCYASFEKARELGATTIILYSNSILTPALRLYAKVGFHHLAVDHVEYKRSDVKMMIDLSTIKQTEPINH